MRRALAAVLLLCASAAASAVPSRLNYQGKLANASGDPLTGTYSFRFKLFAAETGGAALFSEDVTGANAVPVVNGIYTVQIGSFTAGGVPYGVFEGPDLYLEVDVNAGATLTGAETLSPRERLNAAAWAVHALGAERLGVGAVISTHTALGDLLIARNVSASSGMITGNYFSVGASTLVVVNGNVGIGDGNPSAKLEIRRPNTTTEQAYRLSTTAGQDWKIYQPAGANDLRFWSDNTSTDHFNLTTGGRVGVGTTGPSARLHVSSAGAVAADNVLLVSSGAAAGQELLGVKGNGDVNFGNNFTLGSYPGAAIVRSGDLDMNNKSVLLANKVSISDTGSGEGFCFDNADCTPGISVFTAAQGGYNGFVFDTDAGFPYVFNSGNVGLGTSNPGARLDVAGHQLFSVAGASITFNAGGPTIGIPAGNTLAFGTSGVERMRIDNLGNVGVGTATPSALLHTSKSGTGDQEAARFSAPSGSPYMTLGDTANGGYAIWNQSGSAALGLGVHGTSAVLNIKSGNAGVGTTGPADRLHVKGAVRVEAAGSASYCILNVSDTTTCAAGTLIGANANRALCLVCN